MLTTGGIGNFFRATETYLEFTWSVSLGHFAGVYLQWNCEFNPRQLEPQILNDLFKSCFSRQILSRNLSDGPVESYVLYLFD